MELVLSEQTVESWLEVKGGGSGGEEKERASV